MKQLVELIEIEKSFARSKKALQKNYNLQTQEYISKTKETIDSLNKEILNKNQIVNEKLASYENIKDDSKKEVKLNPQKIKDLILSQL
jgi:protein subunit release factor B